MTEVAPAARFRDRAGCLTEAGLQAIEQAPVGTLPPELAAHLAGCPRCQTRALARGRAAPRARTAARTASLWRTLAAGTALVVVMVAALTILRWVLAR